MRRALIAAAALVAAMAASALAAPLSAQIQPPSAESIILRASRTWQSLGSFQAEFRQRLDDPLVDHRDSRGMLYQQGASRFAMRFTDPPNSAIVIDGSAVWVYLPEDIPRQVAKWPMPAGPVYNYNLLTWLFDRPLEKYRATWVRQESIDGKPNDVLLLEPVTATVLATADQVDAA
ncbi:MAG TPA: outer membrane lipoprotein carrier protein LolA, partial [Gemmatimonadales bacterium]|nr:outer membrane lipoprotein carrier protein LolA [Gemmatimonadales bacterium]